MLERSSMRQGGGERPLIPWNSFYFVGISSGDRLDDWGAWAMGLDPPLAPELGARNPWAMPLGEARKGIFERVNSPLDRVGPKAYIGVGRQEADMGWICKRCLKAMRRNRWGWFDHLRETRCECQHAVWVEVE